MSLALINRGASSSISDVTGNTPLMTTITAGNKEVLLHMLNAISQFENMSFRDILSLKIKNNKTIFTWAIENNHLVLIEVSTWVSLFKLLSIITYHIIIVGSNPTWSIPCNKVWSMQWKSTTAYCSCFRSFGYYQSNFILRKQTCFIPLCHIRIQVLLKNKRILDSLNQTDSNGKTPLMLAAEYGHLEWVYWIFNCVQNSACFSYALVLKGLIRY